jgi:hypothetical protein
VSKDIVTLDNEVRTLKDQFSQVLNAVQSSQHKVHIPQQPKASQTMHVQQTPPSAPTSTHVISSKEEDSLEEQEVEEQVHNMLVNMQEEQEVNEEREEQEQVEEICEKDVEEDANIEVDDKQTYSFQDLKDLCKKNGLHTKGTKKQLLELLKVHEIIT